MSLLYKLALVLILCSYPLAASNIKGTIVEASENKALPNATVKLFSSKDSILLKGAIADSIGRFSIDHNISAISCFLTISYIGYESKSLEIDKTKFIADKLDLGSIALNSNLMTDQIVVSADKQQISVEAGKKVFNVDQALSSQGGNAIDVLRTIPSVNVDADGNVSLRGSGAVNIMVDNKPLSMMGDPKQILENLPAALLDKIETITNPGAKYDAEGQSGIINIVLKKKRDDGLNGLVSAAVGNLDIYTLATNLNYKLDDLNFFLSLDGSSSRHLREIKTNSRFFIEDLLNSKVDKIGKQEINSKSAGARFGVDYSIDDKNSLTLSADMRYSNSASDNPNFSSSYNSLIANPNTTYFTSRIKGSGPFEYGNLGLNYLHNFENTGHTLSLDAYYFPSYFDLGSESAIISTDKDQNPLQNANNNIFKTNMNGYSNSYLLQSDYVYPISQDQKFESGIKLYFEGIASKYNFDRLDNQSNQYYRDNVQSSQASHQDNVYAAYINYADKLFGLNYQAGLRMEHTSNKLFDFYQNGNDSANFSRNFTDFFPNLALSYQIDELNSLQLSYSRRINRPSAPMLNPYLDKNDSLYWKSGNPQLLPEFTNSFELGYMKNTDLGLFTFDLFYRYTNQLMNPRFRENVTNTIILEHPLNIGTSQSYGITMAANVDLLKQWKLNFELSSYNQQAEGNFANVKYNQESFGWSSKIVSTVMLEDFWIIQLYADYTSPFVITQGKRFEFKLANLAIKKELFDRKFSLTLNWVDFLNTANFGGNVNGDNFAIDLYNRRDFNYVSLTLSYKINDASKIKQKRAPDAGGSMGGQEGKI
jgi:ferric enterobactin receptor